MYDGLNLFVLLRASLRTFSFHSFALCVCWVKSFCLAKSFVTNFFYSFLQDLSCECVASARVALPTIFCV